MKRFILIFILCALTQTALFGYNPQGDKIKSRWADGVTESNVWQSYPRPQLEREAWQNLNGIWEYGVTNQNTDRTQVQFEGEILVPFAIESSLSGVQRNFLPTEMLWYRRQFTIDSSWRGKNVILNFGAVDYQCNVWLNGKIVGSHKGGNNPFSFDITKYLKRGEAAQTIELSVIDPTDTESISRGKQQLDQKGIWYTPVSGIWQTVWLECVDRCHIKQLLPTTNIEKMSVRLDVKSQGTTGVETIRVDIIDNGTKIKSIEQKLGDGIVEISMPDATLWSPSSPKLYQIDLTLLSGSKVVDRAKSYFAMREVEVLKDENGYNRIALNGKPIFQYGTLDQGWWPDGLLTPPSEEAMLYDMVQLKKMGFNTIRKHIKVEPELYYYYADSLGLMLWQDMVSGFATSRKSQEHVGAKAKEDWVASDEHSAQWQGEMFEMIDRLRFYQSITSWVVFNEGWGQHNSAEIVEKVMAYDQHRIINGISGWADRGVGDMYDVHNYPVTSMILPDYNGDRVSVLGEFGGYGWAIADHLWNPNMRNWGYRTLNGAMDLVDNYGRMIYDLKILVAQGLSAAIYTQTTDVEGEVNGLMTYDRSVTKIPVGLLHRMHSELYGVASAKATVLVEDCQDGGTLMRKVSKNDSSLNEARFPYSLQEGDIVTSEVTFTASEQFENISLWLSIASSRLSVKLNGVEILDGSTGQTRHYNQYNVSDYADLLRVGENTLRVEFQSAKQHSFDFGLRAF